VAVAGCLFIFNFKIIIYTLVFFIIWTFFIIIGKPEIITLQNQWQKNYSLSQDYIYEISAVNIIVGSSMATRMDNDFLPNNYYNLSFGGGGVLTGLEIIKRSKKTPSNIYLEVNNIFKEKDSDLIARLFYPVLWKIKKYVPSLKAKYQPINIFLSYLKSTFGKSHEEHINEQKNDKIYEMNIIKHIINYEKIVLDCDKELSELKKLVQYFEEKDTKIIFFEMPIDEKLIKTKKVTLQREIINTHFVNDWIPLPNNRKYVTSDGIHLLYKSAYLYSKIFISEAEKLYDI
jgi:hypothetical protein